MAAKTVNVLARVEPDVKGIDLDSRGVIKYSWDKRHIPHFRFMRVSGFYEAPQKRVPARQATRPG